MEDHELVASIKNARATIKSELQEGRLESPPEKRPCFEPVLPEGGAKSATGALILRIADGLFENLKLRAFLSNCPFLQRSGGFVYRRIRSLLRGR